MSKIYDAIDEIRMSDEMKANIQNVIVQEYEKENYAQKCRSANRFQKYAACIVLAVCLAGISGIVCAAIHFHCFTDVFHNGVTVEAQRILQQLSKYASSKEAVIENDDYKVAVLANLYSEKQEIGMAVCSITVKKGCDDYLQMSTKYGVEYLKGDESVPQDEFWEKEKRCFVFPVGHDSHVEGFYLGEKGKDGGYLCGIRYSGKGAVNDINLGKCVNRSGSKVEYVMEGISMPECVEMPTAEYVNGEYGNTSIIVSPIGFTVYNIGNKEGCLKYDPESGSDFDNIYSGVIGLEYTQVEFEIRDYASDTTWVSDGEEEGMYNYYQEFARIVNPDDVKSITLNSGQGKITFVKRK